MFHNIKCGSFRWIRVGKSCMISPYILVFEEKFVSSKSSTYANKLIIYLNIITSFSYMGHSSTRTLSFINKILL